MTAATDLNSFIHRPPEHRKPCRDCGTTFSGTTGNGSAVLCFNCNPEAFEDLVRRGNWLSRCSVCGNEYYFDPRTNAGLCGGACLSETPAAE